MILILTFSSLTFFLKFDSNISNLNYVPEDLKQLENEFQSRYGELSASNMIVAKGENLEEALQLNDKINRYLLKAQNNNLLTDYYNLSPILPSREKQRTNIQSLKSIDWEKVENLVQEINIEIGFKKNAFEPFFKEIRNLNTQNISYFTLQNLEGTPFHLMLNEFIKQKENSSIVLSYFHAPKDNVEQVKNGLQNINENVFYVNQVEIFSKVISLLQGELVKLLLVAFAIIFLILFLRYRNIKKSIITIIPTLFGIFTALGFAYLLQGSVNIVSMFALVLIAGIGIDYGIFIVDSFLLKRDQSETIYTSLAVIVAAITTVISFGTLIVSKNTVLSSIGGIIFVGILSSMLYSIFLIPALSSFVLKRRGDF